MSTSVLIAILLICLPVCSASKKLDDVKVIVYKGPKRNKCKSNDDSGPNEILPNHVVSFHFTIAIDDSSTSGSPNEKVFGSNREGMTPSYTMGQGELIPGLERGLMGLCRGSKAFITIPPHLGHGDKGMPGRAGMNSIPGGATIRYDVKIVDIFPPGTAPETGMRTAEQNRDLPKNPRENIDHSESITSIRAFFSMDTNNDSKVDRKELTVAFMQFGDTVDNDFWSKSDIDGDGFLSVDEFVAIGNSQDKKDEL